MLISRIRSQEHVDRGTMRSAVVFSCDTKRLPLLQLEQSEDDLDDYEAAYFVVDGLSVVVHRHAGNPVGEYTVSIDCEGASSDPQNVLREFLQQMGVPPAAVTWVADRFKEDHN